MAGVELAAAVADRLRCRVRREPCRAGAFRGQRCSRDCARSSPRSRRGSSGSWPGSVCEVRTGVAITAVGQTGRRTVRWHASARPPRCWEQSASARCTLPGLESLPHDSARAVGHRRDVAGRAGRLGGRRHGSGLPPSHRQTGCGECALGDQGRCALGPQHLPGRRREGGRGPSGTAGWAPAMAFGIGRSATELYGIPISGLAGWLLRLGFFLRFMPQRRRAVSVVTGLARLPLRGRVPVQLPKSIAPEPVSAVD